MKGWIKLHRGITDHWLWADKPFSRGQAFMDLVLMANHKDKMVSLGSQLVEVSRGSFITSELKLSDRWGWSKTKTRSFLKMLQTDHMIVKKSDRKKTTITIVNYSVYQDIETTEEPQKNHKKTIEEPQKNTNKNVKNEKNNKKSTLKSTKKSTTFVPPTLENVMGYCQEKGYEIDCERFIDFYSSKGWMVGKNKMKDWKAAVRNWVRREKDDSKPQVKSKANHNFDQRDYDFEAIENKAIQRINGKE
ncbi:MAG: hypothetical protein PHT76_15730 [Anaerostipes sp.]|nr:hypothetical protein [Anaerostipes sp.]